MVIEKFLNLLFNPGETLCVSPNKLGYHSIAESWLWNGDFKLIPPEDAYNPTPFWTSANEIQLVAINPINGFRRDENVTAFRSFLVELDEGSMKDQYDYVKDLKLPWSACVFSGNKSLHFAVTLDEDLPDEDTYRFFIEWILKIVSKADQKTKNPSRSIRFAGNLRKETGEEMKLLEMRERVKLQDLMSWLSNYPHLDPRNDIKKTSKERENPGIHGVPMWVWKKLGEGIDESKGRNNEWFGIFMEFGNAGYPYEEVVEILEPYFTPERDFRMREWRTIAKSACKRS